MTDISSSTSSEVLPKEVLPLPTKIAAAFDESINKYSVAEEESKYLRYLFEQSFNANPGANPIQLVAATKVAIGVSFRDDCKSCRHTHGHGAEWVILIFGLFILIGYIIKEFCEWYYPTEIQVPSIPAGNRKEIKHRMYCVLDSMLEIMLLPSSHPHSE